MRRKLAEPGHGTKALTKKRTVPYDAATASRVRELLSALSNVSETLLMGNLAFLLDGTMCCTVGSDGMLIRVLPEQRDALLAKPNVTPMTMGTRTMKGFVRIAPAAYRTRATLARWLEHGCQAARAR